MSRLDLLKSAGVTTEQYPFTPKVFATPHGEVSYLDEGTGPVVVMAHGTPSWSWDWTHAVKTLRATHRVIAADMLGFGLSDRPAPAVFPYTLEAHTGVLRDLLRHLNVDRFALVVHDFGGPVALPLAVEAPHRVTSLTVMNSWAWPLSVNPDFARQRWMIRSPLMPWAYRAFNMSPRVMVKASWGKRAPLDKTLHQTFMGMFPTREDREGTVGFLLATTEEDARMNDLSKGMEKLRDHRAGIVWGMADTFIPPLHMERFKALWPRALVEPIAGAGHFLTHEAPEAVTAFIQRVVA